MFQIEQQQLIFIIFLLLLCSREFQFLAKIPMESLPLLSKQLDQPNSMSTVGYPPGTKIATKLANFKLKTCAISLG